MARVQAVRFPGHDDNELVGRLHVPETPRGSVLLAHCFTCSKDQLTTARLAKGLAAAGYAVLRFDFTGLGDSTGDFGATSIATNVDDVVAAATALLQRGFGPCGMAGHSLGGAAVLMAAQRLPAVGSVAMISAPATAAHVRGLLSEAALARLRAGERAEIAVGGRTFSLSRTFMDDLEALADEPPVDRLGGRPLCLVHGLQDTVVDVAESETLFAAARQPKQFVPIPGGDHLFSDRRHVEQVVRVLGDWFDRTLLDV